MEHLNKLPFTKELWATGLYRVETRDGRKLIDLYETKMPGELEGELEDGVIPLWETSGKHTCNPQLDLFLIPLTPEKEPVLCVHCQKPESEHFRPFCHRNYASIPQTVFTPPEPQSREEGDETCEQTVTESTIQPAVSSNPASKVPSSDAGELLAQTIKATEEFLMSPAPQTAEAAREVGFNEYVEINIPKYLRNAGLTGAADDLEKYIQSLRAELEKVKKERDAEYYLDKNNQRQWHWLDEPKKDPTP